MKKLNTALAGVVVAGAMTAVATPAAARSTISIVGSSTVYPFATVVAERFGRNSDFPTPKLESTGSGGGMKLFCQGLGTQNPDITNASRRMKLSEFKLCQRNGVEEITEFRIGSDGIVIASSREAQNLDLTLKQLFLALAEKVPSEDGSELVRNPNQTWSDVDSSLPDTRIRVMGPPPTSGTRDAFVELGMQGGCEEIPIFANMEEEAMEQACHSLRQDGAYVEAGENDNLIVQKLMSDNESYGVFGYSFLEENGSRLQAAVVNGMKPTVENIARDDYPIARSLWFYVKKAHVGVVPGIQDYVAEFASAGAMGPNGYLKDVGLIVPTREQLMELAGKAESMPSMTGNEL